MPIVTGSGTAPSTVAGADKTVVRDVGRVAAIDVVRGMAMILMAIDHVRVYSGLPAGGPTPGIFLTRWITHFVAPTFIFLAGTSAFLHGRKLSGTPALARFLLTRGLWLVLLELTVLRVAWTFNFDFSHYLLAGVIWVIGWSMVLLAGLIFLPTPVVTALGLVLVMGHNIVDLYARTLFPVVEGSRWAWLWQVLYFGGPVQIGQHGPTLFVLYSIVPWMGVMALGYAFGHLVVMERRSRDRICLMLGAAAIGLFLVLRGFNVYGDPRPWVTPEVARAATGRANQPPAWISFLNTTKYPASLLFLLMTLGPVLLTMPFLKNARGRVAGVLTTFGRVPFFFYMLHIPLIHLAAVLVSLVRLGSVSPWLFLNHPVMIPRAPDGYIWSLGLLYLVWAIVVVVLYFPCRWFAGVKQRHKNIGLLSYL